jgi:hypothetical protein
MNKLFIALLLFFSVSTLVAQKKVKYIDEFGKELTKKQVENLEIVKGKENLFYVKYGKIEGVISDSLKHKIIHFLNEKSNKVIDSTSILIISSNISEGNCNIQNLTAYADYKLKIEKLQNAIYYEVSSQENTDYFEQIFDEEKLIFDNFFAYYKWEVNPLYKCGGDLLIFPDNTFIRLQGDGSSSTIFTILK